MKSISKDSLEAATVEQLQAMLARLRKQIADSVIEWKNSKGEVITCPWSVFNASGSLVFNADQDQALWDVGRRVQIRCEAERQHAGNQIASFKAQLVHKTDRLTATVKTMGLKRANCKVMDQLAEAQSVLGNASKIDRELFERQQKILEAEALAREKAELIELDSVKREVGAEIKAQKAVKEAFNKAEKQPEAVAA